MSTRLRTSGFSLVELLLVLVVLMTLLSAAVIHLAPLQSRSSLPEGVQRFEAILRQARAEAALRGRRVRVTWSTAPTAALGLDQGGPSADSEAPILELAVEPDPLDRPGEFVPLQRPGAEDQELSGWIRIERSWGGLEVPAPQAGWAIEAVPSGTVSGNDRSQSELVFDPEGRSAGARWLIAAVDPSDPHRFLVALDGFTGRVTHRLLGLEEVEAWLKSEEEPAGGMPGLPVFPDWPAGGSGENR